MMCIQSEESWGDKMVDLVNTTLIVKSVERDPDYPDIICHVMKPTPDLPLQCPYLVGENGEKYEWVCHYKRKGDKPGEIMHVYELADESLSC